MIFPLVLVLVSLSVLYLTWDLRRFFKRMAYKDLPLDTRLYLRLFARIPPSQAKRRQL